MSNNGYPGLLHTRTTVGAELQAASKTPVKYPFCRTAPILPAGSNGIPFLDSKPIQPPLVIPDQATMQSFTDFPELPGLTMRNKALHEARFHAYMERYNQYEESVGLSDSEVAGFSLHSPVTRERLYQIEAGWNSHGAIRVPAVEELFWLACWERQHEPESFKRREAYLKVLVHRNERIQEAVLRKGVIEREMVELVESLAKVRVDPDAEVDRLLAGITGMDLTR